MISEKELARFGEFLRREEKSAATIEKYLRDAGHFVRWLGGRELTKDTVAAWKDHLLADGQAPATVNGKLSALSAFLSFLGQGAMRVKLLRIQRSAFRDTSKELTREEYTRLVDTARAKDRGRLCLLLETICATGVRVSEVKYITVESAKTGRVDVALKGKIRTVLLPSKLCRKLLQYAKKNKTASGEIFRTGSGKGLSRGQIWREMKSLCAAAGVAATKVFPHNLRHLFASMFYKATRDIAKLADVLGHSSIDTTRIYLITTGAEHARQLERLGLVS